MNDDSVAFGVVAVAAIVGLIGWLQSAFDLASGGRSSC